MVLTTTDDEVIQTMPIGDSQKAIVLLNKRSDEESLQRVSNLTMLWLSVLKLVLWQERMFKSSEGHAWLVENHSDVSQISDVALRMAKKIFCL